MALTATRPHLSFATDVATAVPNRVCICHRLHSGAVTHAMAIPSQNVGSRSTQQRPWGQGRLHPIATHSLYALILSRESDEGPFLFGIADADPIIKSHE
ncbi:hypothetical protein Caka_3086 [Coraliomargarita akajimensis DSM 45221]|uniref:Uncharacterized protein n=1 Tax=Coraliomargarita akajimensis (strain DSM 45221 / IAM 15411 / JCM 23193 / KCTC 12865 / 04OKA010-24) TaxID=583355 RepID=D5EI59_CORAD|nr:hypothetical protein Caka_3086 [Coraliomargarita akajimensis DSM 45221]